MELDQQHYDFVNDKTLTLETRSALEKMVRRLHELEAKVRFLEEHSSEAKLARTEREDKAKAEAEQKAATENERRRLNRIMKGVSENGQFMTMGSGMVLQVHARSQAYTRRWKPEAVVGQVEQAGEQSGWFWIENVAAPKSEQRALVRIME